MDREAFLILLTKKLTGDLSEKEQSSLDSAIEANEEYRHIHQGILFQDLSVPVKLDAENKLSLVWEKIERSSGHPKKKAPVAIMYAWKTADAVIIGLGLYWLLAKTSSPSRSEQMVTINTGAGKLDTVLNDGTHIIVDENSQISFNKDFGLRARNVILEGNAYFDVIKNTKVPLTVHAGLINVVVKGTAFYVDNDPGGNVEVKLLRGIVEISNRMNSNDKVTLKPNQRLIAWGGGSHLEYAVSNYSNPLTPSSAETLTFNNKRLDSLVMLLEIKYNTKIEIRNDSLKSKRFSGRIGTETLQDALDALQFTYPFFIRIENHIVIIE